MNGPQRTAYVAKGYSKVTNSVDRLPHRFFQNKAAVYHCNGAQGRFGKPTHTHTVTLCNSQSGRFTEPLPDNNVYKSGPIYISRHNII